MVKKKKKSKVRSIASTLACTTNRSNKTPLFEAILQCNWIDIQAFLLNGTWPSDHSEEIGDSTLLPLEQAQEWATYYDGYSGQKLRQLPLHAAINHLAPLSLVQALVQVYPDAVRLRDNKGNLPLHLAFVTNAQDVSSFLLRVFPEGLMESNDNGDLPMECAHHLYGSVMTHNKKDKQTPQQSPREEAESREQRELLELEQQVARDKHVMDSSEIELHDIKEELRRINSQSRRLLRSLLTAEECRTGSVDL